jgi:hypothetical protein
VFTPYLKVQHPPRRGPIPSHGFLWDVKCYPETVERAREQAICNVYNHVELIGSIFTKIIIMRSIYYISSVEYKILRQKSSKAAWNKQIKGPQPHDVDSSTK